MHETTHDDEREVARPNDSLRAALLEALDLADRAGVALSWAQGSAVDGRCTEVHLQGRDGHSGRMPRTDALRIILRARGQRAGVGVSKVFDVQREPWLTLRSSLSGGAALEVYTTPTDQELRQALEAAVVEAVLQS